MRPGLAVYMDSGPEGGSEKLDIAAGLSFPCAQLLWRPGDTSRTLTRVTLGLSDARAEPTVCVQLHSKLNIKCSWWFLPANRYFTSLPPLCIE